MGFRRVTSSVRDRSHTQVVSPAPDAFQLQPLEPRILLSADGLVGPAAAMPDATNPNQDPFEPVTVETDATFDTTAADTADLSSDQLQGEPESLLDGLATESLADDLKENLEAAGCSIPFPQRDVHLHQAD